MTTENFTSWMTTPQMARPPPPFNPSAQLSIATNVTICVGMLGIGLTADVRQIWYYLKRPKAYLIGVGLQLLFVPLIAWALTKIFVMDNTEALGVMIQGCSPGGTVSNVVVFWVNGVINLSIAMTSTTTILALGTMPLWLLIFEKGNNLSGALKIPFEDLGITLATFMGPLLLGMLCSWYFRKREEIIAKIAKVIIALASLGILVITIVGAVIRPIRWTLSWQQGVIVALMPATIYAVGHLVCSIPVLKLGPRIRRTVGIEIAFQNVQVCSAVLTTTFLATQPRIFGQLILFPLLYYIFQIAYAVLYLVIVRVGRKYGYFEEEEQEPVVALTDEKTPADHQAEIGKDNPVYLKEEKL